MYTNPDQENVMCKILNTLKEHNRKMEEHNRRMDMMQQEHNRRMDMMMQLMARQMGINLYVAPVQEVVAYSDGTETHIKPPIYDVGDMGVSAELVETYVQSQETTYEALSEDGDATIVELEECKDIVISAATSMSVEPSNMEFKSMNAVVDVFSNEVVHVADYEFSSTTDLVQFSVAAVSDVPMFVSVDVTTPIVDTIGMRKKTFHESSIEFLSGAILTSSAQVLKSRLQGLVLMMLVCSWFNFHMDITYYFNWDLGGRWSSLSCLIAW